MKISDLMKPGLAPSKRRSVSLAASLCLAATMAVPAAAQTGTPPIQAFDEFMTNLLQDYSIPGGAIAVTQNGHLLMARGYGLADKANQTPVQPDSLFRIASLSKLVTSVTIMHLIDQGKLTLDEPAFALLPDLQAPAGATEDPRLASITIANLLDHSGGWDNDKLGYDPMVHGVAIAAAMGVPTPASTENTIRYMRGQPLNFDPGTQYSYSNFGYAVLGRIVERVTGMSYEQYVRTNVLAPMGITDMRIGQTLAEGQLPGEVKYYSPGQTSANIFPGAKPEIVPLPYGTWSLETMDANGGWVATAIDYVKLLNAIEGRRGTAFLTPSSISAMTAKPLIPVYNGQNSWYGFGLAVMQEGNGLTWWHNGALDGSYTWAIRTDTGFDFVVFLNTRQVNGGDTLDGAISGGLWQAAFETTNWPNADYFSEYPDADPVQAAGVPAITTREGVLNTATNDRGAVSGSWVTISGVNLSKTTRIWTKSDFVGTQLPTSLDGVSVTIDGKAAAVYFISPTQIQAQVPAGIGDGWVTVQVDDNGTMTTPVLTQASKDAPGLFTQMVNGTRFAMAVKADGTSVGPSNPVSPGDTITIFGTGLTTSEAGVVIHSRQSLNTVTVQVAGVVANLQYAGLASAGLFQINFVVPEVPSGNQEVILDSNFLPTQSGVMLPVAR